MVQERSSDLYNQSIWLPSFAAGVRKTADQYNEATPKANLKLRDRTCGKFAWKYEVSRLNSHLKYGWFDEQYLF